MIIQLTNLNAMGEAMEDLHMDGDKFMVATR